MLELILKLYSTYMAVDVRSPVPHLFGPPGCGKSTVVEQAAELIGVNLHIINVSRLSPLEIEGVQMPHTMDDGEMLLRMLPATFWKQIKAGDILLLDEFLRGFPEVYNALLDILTSRRVGAYVLPKVFIIAASNTTVSYDKALEDRLLHLPVPDPRKLKSAKKVLAELIVDQLGLMPDMATSMEMATMLDTEVLPMYAILDDLKNGSTAPTKLKGRSIRNLIGSAQLREVQSPALAELLAMNNRKAMAAGKIQYVFFHTARSALAETSYENKAKVLQGSAALTEIQSTNLDLNLQLIEMEKIRYEKEGTTTDDDDTIDPDIFN